MRTNVHSYIWRFNTSTAMPKFHELQIADARRETADCVSLAFAVPAELKAEYDFLPGQYLTLRVHMDGQEVRRSYSICSSPYDGELRVAVKRVPGGLFSTYANDQLKAGDALDVMTPMGNFTTPLDASHKGHYVAFAAGSGITPVMSLIKSVLKAEPHSRFTLFYGNRSTDAVIFREQLEGLKNVYLQRLSVHYIMSREYTGSDLFSGRIGADKCRAYCTKLFDVQEVTAFFLCGPIEMTNEIRDTLQELGVARKNIHVELFSAGEEGQVKRKTEKAPGTAVLSQITVKLDGNQLHFPLASNGETILEAALKAGADLPFACKGGVCSTCRAKLVEGRVDMDRNYALEPDELEAGYILTCQSHPTSDKVMVDFDG